MLARPLDKNMRISIVIPVHNEASQLAECLRAISKQKLRPYEVIVVDNNSTDNSVKIAKRFKFVRVISAKRQGVVYARDRGFNSAKGDVIGRIDADTRLPVDWTAKVMAIFASSDVDAVSGAIDYHDIPYRRLVARFDLLLRRRVAKQMEGEVFLQGANMAMLKSAWQACKSNVCHRSGLHEDFDLAIHLSQAGRKVVFCQDLKASISARCVDDNSKGFWKYVLLSPSTYADHELKSGRHMYLIVVVMLVLHLPIRAIYRAYNEAHKEYIRVNPATYVD